MCIYSGMPIFCRMVEIFFCTKILTPEIRLNNEIISDSIGGGGP